MFKDENRHYSLRKLSVGLASVLIGISFASMTGNSVHADAVESGSNSAQTVVKGSDTAVKIDAKDDTNAIESNTESADEASKKDPNVIAQDIKQKATKGDVPEAATKNTTDGSQIVAKSALKDGVNTDKDDSSNVSENGSLTAKSNALKATVEAAKRGSETPSVSHDNSNETTLNVKGSEVKGNQGLTDPAKSKLKMATLMTTTGKKFNTKMLFASKVVSPANDTNGGFDSSWGKLNVNDWKGSVQGDYYQLTDYTGDANHVIVPNEADFAKAGVDISGKQVGVTRDFMHTIFRDKTTAQDATVAFSKTDNKMVKAIDNSWYNTWGHGYENINGSYGRSKGKLAKFDGSNLDVSNVTNMSSMFVSNQISDLTPLSNWKTDNVTNMSYMFWSNPIKYANLSNWTLGRLVLSTVVDSYRYYGPLYSFLPNTTIYLGNSALPNGYYQTNINHVKNNSPFNSTADHNLILTTNQEYLHTDVAQNAHNYLTFTENGQATKVAMPVWVDATGVSADKTSILNKVKSLVDAEIAKKQKELGNSYSITMDPNVDQTDPLALINASFIVTPKTTSVNVKFTDIDPNQNQDNGAVKAELAKTITLTGNVGSKIDLSQVQLPTNFELSGDLPSVTFGATDSVTIQLKHKLSNNLDSQDNGYAMAYINVIAPDGTILIHGEAGIQSFIDQRQDLVTGEMVKGDTHWIYGASSNTNVSSDILNKYIEHYNPVILDTSMNQSTESWDQAIGGLRRPLQIKLKDGYTVDNEDWENWGNNDTYSWVGLKGNPDWNTMQRLNGGTSELKIVPLDQSVHYQFMDNGAQVGSDVIITGKTGETVAPNLPIPENYEVADGTTLPTSYTFAATNPTIQINLKHKTETSVESLPATRTINVHLPNGTTKVYQQVIGYQRDVITDLVTKTVTRGTWTVNDVTSSFTIDGVKQLEHSYVLRNGNYNFAGIKLPKVPGYKAKVSKNNGLLLVSYLALAPEKPEINTNSNELQFSNNLAVNSTVKSDLIVKSDMYQVINDNHNWQLPVIKNYELKFATNKNQIIFAYTKDKQNNYRFVLTFKDGQYRLATFDKENKLLKTYSIKSYDELAKIIHSLVLMNIA